MKHAITVRTREGSENLVICDRHFETYLKKMMDVGYSSLSISSPLDEHQECKLCLDERRISESTD